MTQGHRGAEDYEGSLKPQTQTWQSSDLLCMTLNLNQESWWPACTGEKAARSLAGVQMT